ncbi:MAG: hypothetical protein HN509_14385 [Halobacteriovoraceae bacterium]|jgi:hypothetical protein|nr:hypothetical protein [Halobacteriovoraceae bacterium]MBT5095246.1 hypothetical protein [Halobacteriovoraceae bacterium]
MRNISIAITLLLTFCSCSFLIPSFHKVPATDFMLIHKNPRAGDYAVYEVDGGRIHKVFEVMEVGKDQITIRYGVVKFEEAETWKDKRGSNDKQISWYYRILKRSGSVIAAWMLDGDKKLNSPIARSGQMHSLEHRKYLKKPVKEKIETKAGSYKITGAYNYIYRLDLGIVSSKSTHFNMLSTKVPFLSVREEIVATSKTGPFLKTLEFISAAGEAVLEKDYLSLYDKLNPEVAAQFITVDLIEHGSGKKN